MAGSAATPGLVVGAVDSHPLVHLRVAGGDETMCSRPTGVDWPSKTFRSAGCLTCLGVAIESGYSVVLDADGTWVGLENLLG
jgi:hypothetical protein